MTFPDPSGAVDAAVASQESNVNTEQTDVNQTPQNQVDSQTVHELEKLGKFKFQGRDYTPDALKKELLLMKDYTSKTQKIAEERKSFEQKEKFYQNLAWDLERVKQNPNLVTEFIKVYPSEFHSILKDYLMSAQPQQVQQQQRPQPGQQQDVELLSRLSSIEQTFAKQEIEKNEAVITSTMERMSKKYPDAIADLVLARAYEVHESGTKLTEQVWEQIYKQVDTQGKSFVKARYGELVKQQKSANERARGVESGGGIPGQAPKKYASGKDAFKAATENAVRDLSQKR